MRKMRAREEREKQGDEKGPGGTMLFETYTCLVVANGCHSLNFVLSSDVRGNVDYKLCGSKFQLISYRWRWYQSLGEELWSV